VTAEQDTSTVMDLVTECLRCAVGTMLSAENRGN
jgi:hypothetical protein